MRDSLERNFSKLIPSSCVTGESRVTITSSECVRVASLFWRIVDVFSRRTCGVCFASHRLCRRFRAPQPLLSRWLRATSTVGRSGSRRGPGRRPDWWSCLVCWLAETTDVGLNTIWQRRFFYILFFFFFFLSFFFISFFFIFFSFSPKKGPQKPHYDYIIAMKFGNHFFWGTFFLVQPSSWDEVTDDLVFIGRVLHNRRFSFRFHCKISYLGGLDRRLN